MSSSQVQARYSTRLNGLPKFFRRHKIIDFITKIWSSQRLQKFSFGDSQIVTDLRFPDGREPFIKKSFTDYGYFALANALLGNDSVHLDIGANFGFHTFGLCPSLSERRCTYHLFEPNSNCVSCLHLSASLFPKEKFFINHVALGRKAGSVTLCYKPNHLGGGFINEKSPALTSTTALEQVAQITLDQYVEEQQIQKVDLAKVDIEGHELEFINGGLETLARGTVACLYMEISEDNLTRASRTPDEIYKILQELGFHLLFPHRKPQGHWATYRAYNADLELTDFHTDLASAQYDILAVHDTSPLWKSRVSMSRTTA